MGAKGSSLMQLAAVVALSTFVAGFLVVAGIAGDFLRNLVISHCIGLSTYGVVLMVARLSLAPRARLFAMVAAVPGAAGLGVALSWLMLGPPQGGEAVTTASQVLLMGVVFGGAITALFVFERAVANRTREVIANQEVTILAMACLAETRDPDTGNHLRRTQSYVKALAEKLQHHDRFKRFLTGANINLLFKTAPLHDIGKVGIPDRVLLNPGRFNSEEFEIMKMHTTIGRDVIEHAMGSLETNADFLGLAKTIAYSHQEKWDGSGYPEGLAGDAIPIPARLMAVADVYDALISRRVYKAAMPHEMAVQTMAEGRGRHFDPDVIDAFVEIQDEFGAIAQRFADSDGELRQKLDYRARAAAESATACRYPALAEAVGVGPA